MHLNLLFEALVEHIGEIVIRVFCLFVNIGTHVSNFTIFRHLIECVRHKHSWTLIRSEIVRKQMDVRHSVALLLVAGFVQFPLIDIVQVGSQLQLVVIDDLLYTILSVAHYV